MVFSEDLREKIRDSFRDTKNYRETGRRFNISHQSVKYVVENDYEREKDKPGPSRKIDDYQMMSIKREVRKAGNEGQKVTARKIKENLQIDDVSERTIRRTLSRAGFDHQDQRQMIQLTAEHKRNRVKQAEKWIETNHPWERTIFSDEKKFNLDGPDNWSTWTDPGHVIARDKRQMGGRGHMVWGMLEPDGQFKVSKMEGKFDSKKYCEQIGPALDYLDYKYGVGEYYFQQDNASVHASKYTQEFLKERKVKVIPWPAKSPDLNPVENVWKMMSDRIYENKQYSGRDELWTAIHNGAIEISRNKNDTLKSFFGGMRCRLLKIVKNKGDTINK